MSKARDIADSGGRSDALYTTTFIKDSGSYTLTAGSSYNIIAIGGGGAGGGASIGPNVNYDIGSGCAQGGASGAICQKYVAVEGSDLTLTISIGANGVGVDSATTGTNTSLGGSGGTTTVTGTDINMTANGGSGGTALRTNGTATLTIPAMTTRATASGGDNNIDGRICGSVAATQPYRSAQIGATLITDSPAISNLYANAGTNDNQTFTPITDSIPFAFEIGSSGMSRVQSNGTAANDVYIGGRGDYGMGGGGAVGCSGDTSTGTKSGQGGDGGSGLVVINEYRKL